MTEAAANLRIFGICGRSGQGKTTLIEALLPWFHARGLVVNVVKHSHHSIDLEPPGKDSARFRAAGAGEVLIASPYRYAIVRELHDAPEPPLADLVARLAPADLTLVEGFTREPLPRLEVVRPEAGRDPLYLTDTASLRSPPTTPCVFMTHPLSRFCLWRTLAGLVSSYVKQSDSP